LSLRRQNENHHLAFIKFIFEINYPVGAPGNRFLIEKTIYTIRGNPAVELFNEILILPTIAEKDFAHFHISDSIHFSSVFVRNIVDKSIKRLTKSDNILT
jgi:hypothetical protein